MKNKKNSPASEEPDDKKKDKLLKQILGWQDKPMNYLDDVLGIKHVWRKPGDLDAFPGEKAIWRLQEDLVLACPRAIKERKHIYVASGHSCGKDYIVGAIALTFLQSRMPSLVVETAPTDRQVKDIMYKETRSHWENKRINLGGKAFTEPRIEIEKDWYLVGFTTKESKGSAESGGAKFQGFKGKDNVCVLVTEAQAVEDVIYDQIDAITTGQNILVIFIGNPTRAKGRFAKGLKDKEKNIVFHFSCLENPNYVEKKSVIPGLASYQWVEDMRAKWGEDDPRWIGRVLGKVPDGAVNNVYTEKIMNHLKERHGFLAKHSDNRGVALDPAGEGVDDNVFMAGSGGEIIEKYTKTLMSPSDTAMKAVEMCRRINGKFIIVDCDGLGQRDFAELRKLPESFVRGIRLIPFYGSSPSRLVEKMPGGKERLIYGNMRAEAAFVAQDRANAGRAAVNEKDLELIEELEADEYFEKRGVIWLIDKSDIREVLLRSPGSADAWKMLQWAFQQEYKDETYGDPQGKLPAYAITDDQGFGALPRYGINH